MPQMAPIWWSTLFWVFLMTYITIMTFMYFFNIYKMKTSTTMSKKSSKFLNWKW